jgi:amino acid adenylation domain-containing protein
LVKTEGRIGVFVNTLVMRTDLGNNPSFRELLERVCEVVSRAYTHHELPFEKLVEELALERYLSHTPPFQVMFVYENSPKASLDSLNIENGAGKCDLNLSLVDMAHGLTGTFEYNTNLFDANTISRMVGHFQTLLEGIVAAPDQRLSDLPLLTADEQRQQLVAWNPDPLVYPKDLCLHQPFEIQVERKPDAVAIVFENEQLTYRDLNGRANQLANLLQKLGVKPEIPVGLYMHRSLELAVGVLGILKSGGACVPIDSEYPSERISFILEDSRVPVLLTQKQLLKKIPEQKAHVVCIDTSWEDIARESTKPPVSNVTAENIAYILYTSGSTGNPKGVMISHLGRCREFWEPTAYRLTETDRRLIQSSSFLELFWPLWVGGQGIIVRPGGHRDSAYLVKLISKYKVTELSLIPSMLEAFLEDPGIEQCQCLKHVSSGADAWSAGLQDRFFTLLSASLQHTYGLTELSSYATLRNCQRESHQPIVSIGRPVAGMQVYLLDSHLQLVPIGVVGELYVSSVGLARGYLNRPDLTAEKFIPNPFSDEPGTRMLKTGDLARYRPDGTLEFLARIDDNQVKIRGFRIELGEIEAVLSQHPAVRKTVVIDREDVPVYKHLVAYVVPVKEQVPTVTELHCFLKQKLPDYMIPSAFVFLATLPLTPNGKVDRRALPLPDQLRPDLSVRFVAPRSLIEQQIADIWAQILKLEHIGIHDNFFELGGHSLLATQVISRLRQTFCVEVPLRYLFEKPTVAEISGYIEVARNQNQNQPRFNILPVSRNEEFSLSFAQQRLWFLHRLEGESAIYNMPIALHLSGQIYVAALEQAVVEIIRRHEVLRTTFPALNGSPVQAIAPTLNFSLLVVDLQSLPEVEQSAEVQRLANEEQARPFDLANGPLLRVTLLRLGKESHVLLVAMHHIISDGWSMGIFIRELSALYQAYCAGEPSPLPELPIQYADFAHWQRQYLTGEVLEAQLDYWKEQLAGIPPLLELPTARPRPPVQTFRGGTIPIELNIDLTKNLKTLSQKYGATLFMTLLAAFAALLSRYSGQEDIVVGSPIANRNRAEIESLIGFFVNTLVMRTKLPDNPSFEEVLKQVRQLALEAYAHQDVPFEQLVEALQPERNLSHTPLFQVMFVLQNAPMGNLELPGLSLTPVEGESAIAKFDLTLLMEETDQGLKGSWEYNSDLFDATTIGRISRHFKTLLEGIVVNPQERVGQLPMLTEAERQQLLVEWNEIQTDYPQDKCIHQLFQEQVERTPDAVAVVFEGQQLTYRELNSKANQLANYLQKLEVKPEVLVGICLERSPLMLVALLAILKAGGAYVPLDPDYPAERLAFMLEDTQVPVLLTQQSLVEKLPANQAQIVCLDTDWDKINCQSQDNPTCTATADNLAYVTFTSGSTGKPKGVCAIHRGVVRLVKGIDYANLSSEETFLQLAPISFDASTFEIWGSLLNGARLAIFPPPTPSLEELGQAIRRYQVTTLWLTAGLFHLMVDERLEDLKPLRQLLAGGDVLSVSHVHKFLQERGDCHLINGYGPTENTTFTCCYRIAKPSQLGTSVPIGRPISNTQIYILDRHLQPVPIGVPGELYIGGDGLARGYLNRPELTEEKFISNPFDKSKVKSQKSKARDIKQQLYKTGDLARYLPDGNIEFLGRLDHQVKIRGFCIELGEIESVLSQHPAVREAAVTAREDIPRDKSLVAYVVPSQEQKPTIELLRSFLKQKLPDYMVPAAFIFLEALPLTLNGKVDRRGLTIPHSFRPEFQATYVAPQTDLEKTIATVWQEVLMVERVGRNDNFFDLGGNSLLAIQVQSSLQKIFEHNFSIVKIFQYPTISTLAKYLSEASSEDNSFEAIQERAKSRRALMKRRRL